MVDKEIRKAIENYAIENEIEEGIMLFDASAYDKSIVGITDDGRAIYDFNKMVEEYAHDNACDETEAIEWIEYNTMRALPYAGPKAPEIIYPIEDVIARYGE